MVDSEKFNEPLEVDISSTGTLGVWEFTSGSMPRSFDSSVLLNTPEAIDIRVDVGVLDSEQYNSATATESDVTWFEGVVTKSKSGDSTAYELIDVTADYLRVVLTSAGSTTATLSVCRGRN